MINLILTYKVICNLTNKLQTNHQNVIYKVWTMEHRCHQHKDNSNISDKACILFVGGNSFWCWGQGFYGFHETWLWLTLVYLINHWYKAHRSGNGFANYLAGKQTVLKENSQITEYTNGKKQQGLGFVTVTILKLSESTRLYCIFVPRQQLCVTQFPHDFSQI